MVKSINSGRWSTEEHKKFVEARILKLRWEQTSQYIGTRTTDQCRSHEQKMKIKKQHKENLVFINKPKMVDKSTQYEVPPSVFADRPVYSKDFEVDSSNTKDSDFVYDFECMELDFCDDYLVQ